MLHRSRPDVALILHGASHLEFCSVAGQQSSPAVCSSKGHRRTGEATGFGRSYTETNALRIPVSVPGLPMSSWSCRTRARGKLTDKKQAFWPGLDPLLLQGSLQPTIEAQRMFNSLG